MHDRPQAFATMEGGNRLIGLFHSLKRMRNVLIDRDFTRHHALDEFGNIRPRLETTKRRSLPDAPRHQLKGSGGYFVSRGCHTNHTGGAPSSMRTFQGGPHHVHITGAIKGVVDAPGRQVPRNVLLYGFIVYQIAAVDTVCGAQFGGGVKLVGVDIDGNNPTRTGHFCPLNDGQALWTKKVAEGNTSG